MSAKSTLPVFSSLLFLSLVFFSCVFPSIISQPTSDCPIRSAWNVTIPHQVAPSYELNPLGLVRAPYCVVYGVLDHVASVNQPPQFFVIEITSGRLLWTRQYLPNGFNWFVNEDQGVLYTASDHKNTTTYCTTLHAVDLMTGVPHWSNERCSGSGATNLFIANVLLLSGRNRDGTDYVVQLTTEYDGNVSSTLIQILNSRGRVVDTMEMSYGPPAAEAVSAGTNGYFFTFGWPAGSDRPLLSIWHVTRDGTLNHMWNERRFNPPYMLTPAPLMLQSTSDSTHWVALNEADGSMLWSSFHTGRVFLSPNWPNDIPSAYPAEYSLVTPTQWFHQPARLSHALFSVYRLINFTTQSLTENMGFAVYDTQTGRQIARSDIIPIVHSVSPPPVPPAPSCVAESTTTAFFETVMNDPASRSMIFHVEDSLYVLDADTLETVAIRALPKLAIQCPVIIAYDSQGSSIAYNSDGHSTWLVGIPGGNGADTQPAAPSVSSSIARDVVV